MALSEEEKYAEVLSDEQSPIEKLIGDGSRPMRIIDFPGDRGEGIAVGLWNLYQAELTTARIDAIKWIQDVCKVPDSALLADASLAEEETKNQILFRAMRHPKHPVMPFCKRVSQLRDNLTPDERDALFQQYLEHADFRSPFKKIRSELEVDELISALGKGSTREITLRSFDSASLRSIVRSLAERCSKLMSANSSGTWPPSDTSGLSSNEPKKSDE